MPFFDDNSSVSSSDSKRTVVNNSDFLDLTLLTSDPGESFHAIGIILIRTTTYVILFSPIRGYGRILVPIKLVRRFENAGGTPKPGTWMSFRRVQKLIPNDDVDFGGCTHIATSKPRPYNLATAIPSLKHTFFRGHVQFLMSFDLNTIGNVQIVSDDAFDEHYVLISTICVPVVVPIKRIEIMFGSNSVLTAPYIISLWVENSTAVCGVSLKLMDSTPIEVKCPEGNIAPDDWMLRSGLNHLVLEERESKLETAPLPPTLRENEAVEVEIPPHQRHHRESFEQDRSPPSAPSAVVTENEAVASSELKAQQQQNPCTQPCSMKAASPPPTLRESRAVIAPEVPAQYDHVEPAGTSSIVKKGEVIASVAVETQNHEESVGHNKLLMTVDLNTAGNAQLVSDEESNEYYVLISTTGEPVLAPIDRIENIFVSKSVLTAPYIISLWVEVAHVVFGVSLKLVDSTRIEVKDLEGNMAPDNWLLLAGVNRPVLEEQGGQVEPSSFSWREVSSMEVETQHHQSVEHNRSPPSAPSAVVTVNEAVASSELKAQQQQNPCTQPCSNVPSPEVSLHEYRLPMPEPPNRNAQLKIPRRLIKLNNAEPDW